MKKIISLILAIALCCTISVGLTVAYLTDRDSKANVFTVGDVSIGLEEVFTPGSELIPGAVIEKDVKVANTGKNDAWVWYTYAVPQGLENGLELTFENVDNAAKWDEAAATGKTYTDENGVVYNVYVCLWNTRLASGEKTDIGLTSVKLKNNVDVDPDGNWNLVTGGVATSLNWNNANGNPVIFVSAYGIQSESFADVDDAYDAYQAQWGDNGDAYAPVA